MCVEQTDMCNIVVKKGSDAPRLQFNAVVLVLARLTVLHS